MVSARRKKIDSLVVRSTVRIVRRLPAAWVMPLTRWAAAVVRRRDPGRFEAAVHNARIALGVDESAATEIVDKSFRNIRHSVVSAVRLHREVDVDADVVVEGREHLAEAVSRGRGVLVCSAHFGAWDMLTLLLHHLERSPWLIVDIDALPGIHEQLERMHARTGRGVIARTSGGELMRRLKEGEIVIALVDRPAHSTACRLPFLGHDVRQHTAPGRLAWSTGCAVLPTYCFRDAERGRYRLVFERPLDVDRSLSRDDAVMDMTRRLSESLERRVREDPGQWDWRNDRWRGALRDVEPP